jgi:hypothetical protein
MPDTSKCTHANYDDYSDRCEDCGYEPETCWNCSKPLRLHRLATMTARSHPQMVRRDSCAVAPNVFVGSAAARDGSVQGVEPR